VRGGPDRLSGHVAVHRHAGSLVSELVGNLARRTAPAAGGGAAASSADRRDGVDQRNQLSDVVAVAAGGADGQRDVPGVADQVVLGARTPAIDRRGPDLGPR
jgi:hypothetical protein